MGKKKQKQKQAILAVERLQKLASDSKDITKEKDSAAECPISAA